MAPAQNATCHGYRESFLSPLDFLASAFVTLLVVVDPLGLATIFLAVTGGLSPRERLHVSTRACFFAFTILAGAAIIGDQLLDALGISLPAFRIAGGLLLFSIASEMVFGVRIQREAKTAAQALEEHVHNVAAFPLAIPLMAGPGAITATLLLAGKARGDIMLLVMLVGVIAAVCIVCFAVYQLAGRVERFFGTSGNLVLAKLLGVLLASLAVQYVVDGARELLKA
jgi:multiple antibiotic resistance protein